MNDKQKRNLMKHFNLNLKDQVIINVFNIIDDFEERFSDFEVDITYEEVDIIMDEIYKLFQKKKCEKYYINAVDKYTSNAFLDFISYNISLNYDSLLKSIFYLSYNYTHPYNCSKIEILLLKRSIKKRYRNMNNELEIIENKKVKVISLNDYKKKNNIR